VRADLGLEPLRTPLQRHGVPLCASLYAAVVGGERTLFIVGRAAPTHASADLWLTFEFDVTVQFAKGRGAIGSDAPPLLQLSKMAELLL
jgi:hypothetical protein